jgi:hypothetical protein
LFLPFSWVFNMDVPVLARLLHFVARPGPPLNQEPPRLIVVAFFQAAKV